jgi:hypothetical protein
MDAYMINLATGPKLRMLTIIDTALLSVAPNSNKKRYCKRLNHLSVNHLGF